MPLCQRAKKKERKNFWDRHLRITIIGLWLTRRKNERVVINSAEELMECRESCALVLFLSKKIAVRPIYYSVLFISEIPLYSINHSPYQYEEVRA